MIFLIRERNLDKYHHVYKVTKESLVLSCQLWISQEMLEHNPH